MTDRGLLPRLAFWAALAFAVTMAILPHPPHTPLEPFNDKIQHMLAFGTLALLAATGYAGTPLSLIGERLSFLGAMIEVVQSIPALHRDCDIMDWVADTAIIILVLSVVGLVRKFRSRPGSISRP